MKKLKLTKYAALGFPFLFILGACTSAPPGPTVAVMPTAGKPFEVFQQEDLICRQFADGSIQNTSNAALKDGATSAVVGAALGAVAGALINGGGHQNIGTGAGVGLLGGAGLGAINASGKQNQSQGQYNTAYMQCMYAKGNQVPFSR